MLFHISMKKEKKIFWPVRKIWNLPKHQINILSLVWCGCRTLRIKFAAQVPKSGANGESHVEPCCCWTWIRLWDVCFCSLFPPAIHVHPRQFSKVHQIERNKDNPAGKTRIEIFKIKEKIRPMISSFAFVRIATASFTHCFGSKTAETQMKYQCLTAKIVPSQKSTRAGW